MSTKEPTKEKPPTEEEPPTKEGGPEAVPTEVPTTTEPPEPEVTSEGPKYKLPPTMAEAGGVGVVGLVSGIYAVSNGSYFVSPGQPMMVAPEDAQTLIDQGVAVSLDDYPPAP